ncbi:DNA polymerase sliding clamp [Halococcus agarilyticus]|uniref:DNA polymerase sliding clamp n=1 Tax=Halococcus agarilyticus TaxID=1232219 RepID=UPI0006779377|nr:DNA polymerase sliding clamp [Halococcus agarilyticus]
MRTADDTAGHSFEAIADAETMGTIVDLVDALVDECRIELDDGGIRVPAVDPASVAMVDLELSDDAFESYESAGGRIGVDVGRLKEVVGMADRGQLIEFVLDPETRTLDITIDDLEYTLALIDPGSIRSPPDLSETAVDLPGGVVVEADAIDHALRAADMVSNQVAFGIDADASTFYVEAEGDTDDVSLVLSEDDLVAFTPDDAHSLFSLDYLQAIDRAIAGTPDVDLRLGTETPVEIGYEFADGAGTVEYVVSPRRTVDY